VPEVICDVSPVQYLHQAGLLDILRLRYGAITIPTAVAAELHEGTLRGLDLPAFESLGWMRIRQPTGQLLLPMVTDLGAGEREVLALGTETADSIVILDDGLARQYARLLNLTLTGTLGVLLKAKETGLRGDPRSSCRSPRPALTRRGVDRGFLDHLPEPGRARRTAYRSRSRRGHRAYTAHAGRGSSWP
jgi:predicted nucleic acid-binding protein